LKHPGGVSEGREGQAGLDRLRRSAGLRLRALEREAGPESGLYRACAALWLRAEGEAGASLEHGDVGNAAARLECALDALVRTPEAARRAELAEADLEALIASL